MAARHTATRHSGGATRNVLGRAAAAAVAAALVCCAWLRGVAALDNGLGRTPPLGFNSWNSAACSVNETFMRNIMDAFVATGGVRVRCVPRLFSLSPWAQLSALPPRTHARTHARTHPLTLTPNPTSPSPPSNPCIAAVSVDDCWARSRDANGVIQADPVSFPSGMAALAAYAHARQLKFGLYSSNSPNTCDGRPGSWGYEELDAATYASWGVDLLKYGEGAGWRTCGLAGAQGRRAGVADTNTWRMAATFSARASALNAPTPCHPSQQVAATASTATGTTHTPAHHSGGKHPCLHHGQRADRGQLAPPLTPPPPPPAPHPTHCAQTTAATRA
jgi:hypothetical protein